MGDVAPFRSAAPPQARAHTSGAHGFTLIELLVSIAIIAVLIALAVAALSSSRRAASDARLTATLAEIARAIHLYAADYTDFPPYLARRQQPVGLRVGDTFDTRQAYFWQHQYYPAALAPDYFSNPALLQRTGTIPDNWLSGPGYPTPFWLTHTVHAAPPFWSGPFPGDVRQLVPVALTAAAFPAQKGLILHSRAGMYAPETPLDRGIVFIALFDASAGKRTLPADSDTRIVERSFGAMPSPIMCTPGGVLGRDID